MGCGNDAVAPEPRAFSATLVAADGSRHALAGSAEFVDSSDETGVPTFLIQLFVGSDTNGPSTSSPSIIISSEVSRPDPGTFPINGFSDSTFAGVVQGSGLGRYQASSGELRISASTRSSVEGAFEFAGQGEGPYGETVTVTGSFWAGSHLGF
jgi:hypothetical protein